MLLDNSEDVARSVNCLLLVEATMWILRSIIECVGILLSQPIGSW